MSVKINLGEWGSVFAVPTCVADDHLKIASQNQLKVLLFLLRNCNKAYTYNEIADILRIHEEDVKDCVAFWTERGVLSENRGELSPAKGSAADAPESEKAADNSTAVIPSEKPKTAVTRPVKPDIVTAAQRVYSEPELTHALADIESALGKPLSGGNVAVIVMLYDTCGLPAEVIVMLVNFCVSVGKGNMRAIETTGLRWADDGVYSIEAAEQKIKADKQISENWTRISSVFGLNNVGSPTAKQLEYADRWINQWHFSDDMLRAAYEIGVNAKGEMKLGYINGILARWYNDGVFTPEDIEKQKSSKRKKSEKKSSFDIDKLEEIE